MVGLGHAIGLPVVTRREGAIVGRIDDLLFDLETGRIYGWRIRAQGVLRRFGGLRADHLDQVGRDVAFARSVEDVEWAGRSRTVAEGRAWAGSWKGRPVLTRDGRAIGHVEDLVVDPAAARVVALVMDDDRLLPVDDRLAMGRRTVVAHEPGRILSIPEHGRGEDPDWGELLAAAQ